MIIVTRHEGAVEWLRRQGIEGKVITHATGHDIVGQNVVGVLPFHLAALANSITTIDMDLPIEYRGKDITPEQMDECGAKLETYKVQRIYGGYHEEL